MGFITCPKCGSQQLDIHTICIYPFCNTPLTEKKQALNWWKGRTFEENFISTLKYLGHDHQPGLLTEAQIFEIYQKEKL